MKNSTAKQRAAMLLTGLCMLSSALATAAAKSDAIAYDPCVLVSQSDLLAVLGISFPPPSVATDVDSRTCSYENDKFLISVYTGNEDLAEFQKDIAESKAKNDTWGKNIKVGSVSAPYYQNIGEGRLIVWKKNTRFTVGVQDITFKMSDEALEIAREKLINRGLSRMN